MSADITYHLVTTGCRLRGVGSFLLGGAGSRTRSHGVLVCAFCVVGNIQWLAGSTGEAAGAMPTAAANTQRDLTRSGV